MDYLDPHKEAQHRLVLLVGYVFIAFAILTATYILVNQAYGYGLKNGTVIQNGELLVSSQPHSADIYLNNVINKAKTNTRLLLPGGIYTLRLQRPDYRTWQRVVSVPEGGIRHVDYPLLIPKTLKSTAIAHFNAAPTVMSESLDRRWLLIGQPSSITDFSLIDLKNPTKAATTLSLPTSLLSAAPGTASWQVVSWADDNQHVLLEHLYGGKTEYILLDRNNPEQSVNLNRTLKIQPIKLTLDNEKYNQYYLYDSDKNLQTVSLKSPTITTVLGDVLAYQTYGTNEILYVTNDDAPSGKVLVKLEDNDQTYILHSLPESSQYLADLTTYAGTLYVAVGAVSENKVYIYKDPIGQLANLPTQAVSPIQVLHVANPSYLSFSNNAQFIMAEGATQFGVYDIENQRGFNYTITTPLDAPQTHASWMDGDRLTYISGGQLRLMDYDSVNAQNLVPSMAQYLPAFAPDYHDFYTLVPDAIVAGQIDLEQTSLLTPADQ